MLTSLALGSPVRNASIFPGWYPGQSNASQSSETRRRIEAEFDRHPSGPYCSRTAAPARSETSISARCVPTSDTTCEASSAPCRGHEPPLKRQQVHQRQASSFTRKYSSTNLSKCSDKLCTM